MTLLAGFEHFVRRDEPLAAHTWLRLGGAAEYYAEPTTPEELTALVRRCHEEDVPVRLVGGGSNVLVRDEGVPGVVVRLAAPAFCEISAQGRTVTAGGGAKLGHAISTSVREGLAGLEGLVGIPGTVGGALHGNAASRGGDVGQRTEEAVVMTRSGEVLTRGADEMQFAYRQSSLDELAILRARFSLEPDDRRELTRRMQKLWIAKKASQPMANQNAACVFKDPRGMTASSLIEQAGLKGARVGQAEVSDRHANFIIAHSGATAQDVLRLMDLVRGRVTERLGIELENEIEVW